MKTTFTPLGFLSRLCGGEHDALLGFAAGLFLSRLCGGELTKLPTVHSLSFLSRLCGGELYRSDIG